MHPDIQSSWHTGDQEVVFRNSCASLISRTNLKVQVAEGKGSGMQPSCLSVSEMEPGLEIRESSF